MSQFDNDIKPGDLITAYHAGFHRVTEVKRRFYTAYDEECGRGKEGDEYNSLIVYQTVLTAKYKITKSKKEKCSDASFCQKLTKQAIEERRKKLIDEINQGTDVLLEECDG